MFTGMNGRKNKMKRKKWMIGSAAALMIFCAACGAKNTDGAADAKYFRYEVNDANEVVIEGFLSKKYSDDALVIPARIKGYPVTTIGEDAFDYHNT